MQICIALTRLRPLCSGMLTLNNESPTSGFADCRRCAGQGGVPGRTHDFGRVPCPAVGSPKRSLPASSQRSKESRSR
jgi:hypothetical protein